MLDKVREQLKTTSPTKYNRIRNYMELLEQNVEISSARDKKNVTDIKDLATNLIKKVKVYYRINIILYFAIYFSFFSYFLPDFLLFTELGVLISRVISVFGTTVFIIAVFFSQKIIDLYYQDLNLLTAHLIAIYTKHQKETIEEIMSDKKNIYEVFIEFFRKRY
ncbi:MAG: hypothetical protein PF569_03525 [Candidatus Woesearchaeota archaeon]|jgi:hypothetical protein|nr:hypothetical protein [Candidatus Woesearchaeota archaeon]